MPEKDKSERVRVKAKYAEIVRQVASVREEPFIDALYRIIDFYWDYQNGRVNTSLKTVEVTPTKPVETAPKVEQIPQVDDIDVSVFE